MNIKTPEQIADDELSTDDNWTQTSDPAIVREMLIRAIEADRAQRTSPAFAWRDGYYTGKRDYANPYEERQ